MASLIKQANCRYWIAAFRDASGKQHRCSTRETVRTRALAVAHQYERAAKGEGNRVHVREAFTRFYREHYGTDIALSTTRAYFGRWLAGRKAEIAHTSYARYERTVSRFLDSLGYGADQDLNELTKNDIERFRDVRLEKTTPASANVELKIVRMACRAARLEGYLWQDPAEKVKLIKDRNHHERTQRRAFTMKELRKIFVLADPEWQSLILFGLYTGQRLGDLACLTWSEINQERGEIRLIQRKTLKPILLPMAPALAEHIATLPLAPASSPVHPRSFAILHNQGGRAAALSNQFSELLVASGLRAPRTHQGQGIGRDGRRKVEELSFHSLRHTAVSLLKDAGIPDAVVMALVGHESAAMSQRYTHVGKEALSKAAASLPLL